MKRLSIALLAVASAPALIACDLCSIYSASESRGEPGKGIYAGAAEQFTHFGTLQMDGQAVSNPEDTGITSVFLGPEVLLTWRSHLSAELGADFPVSIDNTALQAVPDWRLRGALTWHF